MSAADMDPMRTEDQAVTDRVKASEEHILDVQHEVKGLKETVLQLLSSLSALLTELDVVEDQSRRANINIRGIPERTTALF
ncbi:Hypothetical predicted protein [Pelobates cultripes]|uniref:Uncharacterized protein n=1 Tax=Pelobates cultripes TaxID=61616 RepID=A0AAD1WER9_PELCU|nr:Hypothetical predicted protein [Pelobates cultripes]